MLIMAEMVVIAQGYSEDGEGIGHFPSQVLPSLVYS